MREGRVEVLSPPSLPSRHFGDSGVGRGYLNCRALAALLIERLERRREAPPSSAFGNERSRSATSQRRQGHA